MTGPEDEVDEALRRRAQSHPADPVLEPYAAALRQMEALRPAPERDPRVAAAGRQALLDQAASQPVSHPALSRHRVRTLDGRKELRPMSALAGLLVAIALLFGGGGLTAFAAQDALPNDVLYGVKLATEDLRFGLTSDPGGQIALLEDWADRRVQEMEEMTQAGEPVPLETALRLQTQLMETLRIASHLQDSDLVPALVRLQSRLEVQLQTMAHLCTDFPNGAALQAAQQAMIQTHAEIRGALDDPAAFRTRYGAGRPADAPAQPEVAPGEPPAGSPGAGGQGSGQGNGPSDGQGSGDGQNPDAGQGTGSQGGFGPGDGTCTCTPRGDGYLVCTAACLQYQIQYQGGQANGGGFGVNSASCSCTTQADGSLLCPETCDPNLYLWLTPGPHGQGQGGSGN